MLFFWLWLLLVVIGVGAFLLIISYYHSKRLLRPPHHRMPVTVVPDQFRLPYEKVLFNTKDGLLLRGWFIPCEGSEKTIIFLHGWGTNRGEMFSATHFLHEAGFNLLYFDFRACGESAGTLSTVGYLEVADIEAALEYLKDRKPDASQQIALHGISMGASVAVYAAAHHPEIKCLVLEALFGSYEKTAGRWAWNNLKIPYYPCVPLALMFVRMKLHADPETYSAANFIDKLAGRPVFVIHGSHDMLVPLKYTQRLYDKMGQPKEMWVVQGAAHAKCAEIGGAEYKKRLTEFFTKNL
jgi:hypothetical protein